MFKIEVNYDNNRGGAQCHFETDGLGSTLKIETTIATIQIIKYMARLHHCSFETAALMLIQQASLLYKDNTKGFDLG